MIVNDWNEISKNIYIYILSPLFMFAISAAIYETNWPISDRSQAQENTVK